MSRKLLADAAEGCLHAFCYQAGVGQLVRKVDEGNGDVQVVLLQGLQQGLFVQAVGFAYLAFHAVALHGTLEASLRHADQYGGMLVLHVVQCQIDHTQREDRERTRSAAKEFLYQFFLVKSFGLMQGIGFHREKSE